MLFVVHWLLLVACGVLFVEIRVCCLMCGMCCSCLCVVRCELFVVFGVWCSLFVVCAYLLVLLSVVSGL